MDHEEFDAMLEDQLHVTEEDMGLLVESCFDWMGGSKEKANSPELGYLLHRKAIDVRYDYDLHRVFGPNKLGGSLPLETWLNKEEADPMVKALKEIFHKRCEKGYNEKLFSEYACQIGFNISTNYLLY